MVIPFSKPCEIERQPKSAAGLIVPERAAAKTKSKLVQIGLKIVLGQTVISAKDEGLRVADHDMQPAKHTAVGNIVLILVSVFFQSREIAAVTIAADCASLRHGNMGGFLHGGLFDILRHLILRC